MTESIEEISNELWQAGCSREEVIRPLACLPHARREDIAAAAVRLAVGRATVYKLLAAYRERPQTSTLVPKKPGCPRNVRFLSQAVEKVIEKGITEFYFTRERPRFSDLMAEIKAQCHADNLSAPDYRTVRRRLSAYDARTIACARHGGRRARALYGAALPIERPSEPLSFVQIDHSPVDVIIVDEQTRLPIGRPWLTLALDVATRMVAGFLLTFDDPSSLSAALVLTQAVLPKQGWLQDRDLTLSWPVSGIPDWIETDNGEEFHSRAFDRGTKEYGIRLTYRPPGSPQVGGHIERLIGTVMQRLHIVPGTTFSSVAEKREYDSENRAVLSLKELERWIALQILGIYHKSVHSSLGCSPEDAWNQQILTRHSPVRHPQDARRFLLDFLPGEQRLVRRDGITLFNRHYWDNVLSPLAGRSGKSFVVKYDPRDLSKVYLRQDSGDYWTIPYRDLGNPSITIWEHRSAVSKLRSDGFKDVDEKLIFKTIAEQRALVAEAKRRARAARLASGNCGSAAESSASTIPVEAGTEASVLDPSALVPFDVEDLS